MTTSDDGIIAVTWTAHAKAGREADVRAYITRVVTPARHDAGNIEYEVHEDESRPGTFVAYERWTSRAALEAHQRAPWTAEVIPALLELLDGRIEDELRVLRPLRPAA